MGAKTVMTMALRDPSCCANIIAVDNAPIDAALASDFPKYVEGMRKTEEAKPRSQKEADATMEPYAKELPVRQFLLTNLVREPNQPLKFRVPVKILADALDDMADFPFKNPDEARFSKRALFIRGTKSHYVSDETLPIIGRFFPRFELVDIEAGHWVISENPEAFVKSEFHLPACVHCSLLTFCSRGRFLARCRIETTTHTRSMYNKNNLTSLVLKPSGKIAKYELCETSDSDIRMKFVHLLDHNTLQLASFIDTFFLF
jgi:hypothetical protein